MRLKFLALATAAALIGCAGHEASLPANQPFEPQTLAEIERTIDTVMQNNQVPGAVVLVDIPGRGYYLAGKGVSNRESGQKMRAEDHFRIGSNTKGFIGTLILALVKQGKVSLDATVGEYVDGVPNGDAITVRNLLNMTSGLPNYSALDAFNDILWSDPGHQYTRDDLLEIAYSEVSAFEPGEAWEYSNTNTVLLGMIIEKRSGMTVAQALNSLIYRPLGMRETSWPTTPAMPQPSAHGYTDDNPTRTVVDATNWNPSWANAAGILISDVSDMAIWARELGTGSLIGPQLQQERLTWVSGIPGANGNYGLAIGRAGQWLHHQGELPGYNTIAAYLPPLGATMVVLANSNVPNDSTGPAAKIMKALSDLLTPQYSPGYVPPEE